MSAEASLWKDRVLPTLLAWVLRLLVELLGVTWRVEVENAATFDAVVAERRPVVFAFWHDRVFFFARFFHRRLLRRGYRLAILVSRSRDGEFGARFAAGLGCRLVRGSSSRGAVEGLRRMHRELASGHGTVLLPDGPRGPRHRLQGGAVVLARMSGAPLLPVTWRAGRSWRLGSWDRLEIPKPFARVTVTVGEPIPVPRRAGEATLAEVAARLEEALGDH